MRKKKLQENITIKWNFSRGIVCLNLFHIPTLIIVSNLIKLSGRDILLNLLHHYVSSSNYLSFEDYCLITSTIN